MSAVKASSAPGTGRTATPAALDTTLTVRRPSAITSWAVFGALVVVIQAFAYVLWFTSGDATPTPTGPDPVPTSVKVWAWTLQAVMVVGTVAIFAWVIRRCLRERRLVFDGILVIVWALQFIFDPVVNYLRPVFYYNSYLVNLGVWVRHLPGWSSPNGNLLPEPLLFIGGFYFSFGMGVTVVASNIMRAVKNRRPHYGLVRLVLVIFATVFTMDFIAEVIFVRAGLYAYPGAIHPLTLWAGHTHQFPIYEPFFVAPILTAMATLRFLRDDRGYTVVDRGIDSVRVSPRQKTGLRILAVCGFATFFNWFGYQIPMIMISLHVDETPAGYPSYLVNGLCGGETGYPCPGPDAHVWVRGAPVPGTTQPSR